MKRTYYKLTDKNGKARGATKWFPGVVVKAKGKGPVKCCSNTAVHAYTSPELAVMLTPLHNNYTSRARLFEVVGIAKDVCWDKVGCRTLTCVKEIPVPEVSTNTKVRFAIYCTLKVCKDKHFVQWAQEWLSGNDRFAAAYYAAAYYAAAYYAADAAYYAADAAYYAAYYAAYAASAAAYTADAAYAAYYAAYAAYYAAADASIDFVELAKAAIEDELAFEQTKQKEEGVR